MTSCVNEFEKSGKELFYWEVIMKEKQRKLRGGGSSTEMVPQLLLFFIHSTSFLRFLEVLCLINPSFFF